MKYLDLWSPGLRNFFEKFVKSSGSPSYILNVRSLTDRDHGWLKSYLSNRRQCRFAIHCYSALVLEIGCKFGNLIET